MTQEMANAVVFDGSESRVTLRKYPVTAPAAGQVLLRMKRSGICGTDIHIIEGRLKAPAPFIPGHEFIGRVEACGRGVRTDGLGSALRAGDTALACVARPCGKCFSCRAGETASCLNFGVTYIKDPAVPPHLHGGYADALHHPANGLVKVPGDMNLDAVAAFPCGGPTAIRAFETAGGLTGDELVVVQGTGSVGLFAIAWAAAAGCKVVAVGSGANNLRSRLAYRMGASAVLDYRTTAPEKRLAEILKLAARLRRGNGADVVFEASGSPKAISEGLQLCRTRGRYIVPGQYSASGSITIQPEIITFKALTIVGSGQYKLSDIGTYIAFLRRQKKLQTVFARCVTHKYRIVDAVKALQNAAKGLSIKGVFAND